jgi:hypothetical protein
MALHTNMTGPQEDVVTISRAEYESLQDDRDWRTKLENAGVDNWTYYSEALNHPEEFL